MTLEQLNKRLEKEMDEIIQEGLDWSVEHDENEHVYFVNHAYEIAHYNEIQAYFEDMEETDFNNDWKELFDGLDPDIEIMKSIYRSWLDYSHPEYYNFFTYEGLIDIIKNWLENHQEVKK